MHVACGREKGRFGRFLVRFKLPDKRCVRRESTFGACLPEKGSLFLAECALWVCSQPWHVVVRLVYRCFRAMFGYAHVDAKLPTYARCAQRSKRASPPPGRSDVILVGLRDYFGRRMYRLKLYAKY